ncbi:MAG TPA: tetratricopeptide repeat protein [Candidatus Saccharimonadales bacterium]|nr:tetratricopeptide repeat protein [Candidatus Saccharimonadales bacterium]
MTHAMVQIARRIAVVAALLTLVINVSGCSKLKARDLLNKGVAAFKNGQSDSAIEDFKRATELDPDLLVARLYLATAYASLYIPGAPSQENMARGTQAIAEFKKVLEQDPKNLAAIDGIGSILYQMAGTPFDLAKFEESKKYHQQHIENKPNDPEPYYWIGVIDWVLSNRTNLEMRAAYNKDHINKQVKETEAMPAAVRSEYVAKSATLTDEGIASLQKALQIKPDYDDAMAYLNLLYRRKADMVESADERASFQKQADDLLDKIKEIKQKRSEQPQQPS